MLNSDMIGLSMTFVIIGHIFPIWLKFKGGKGVATFIGVLLAYNFQLFLLFTFTWLLCALLFKYSSLSAIIALITNLISTIAFDLNYIYFIIVSFLILIKHFSNIQRLLTGNETKIVLKK
jgi:glycerol-3-phosphate acyltransferase PlsY